MTARDPAVTAWTDATTEQTAAERLAEIRERAAQATPGPWAAVVLGSEGYDVRAEHPDHVEGRPRRRLRVARCGYEEWETDKANAEFIAHARADVEHLLAEVERLTAERDDLFAVAMKDMSLRGEADAERDGWRREAAAHKQRGVLAGYQRDRAQAEAARLQRRVADMEADVIRHGGVPR